MYKSQMAVMPRYLLSFARATELFADATVAFVPKIPAPGPAIDGRLGDWPLNIKPMEVGASRSDVRARGVRAASEGRTVEIAIPLELLGNPQRLFLSIESRFGNVVIDRTTWRVLQLR